MGTSQYQIPANMTFPCVYYDESLVLPLSPIQEKSIFISTRITTTDQVLNQSCSLFEYNCTYVDTKSLTVYIADIENFTILFDHSMYVSSLNVQVTSTEIKGTLSGINGEGIQLASNEHFGEIGQFDILRLGTILAASGIDSLDGPGENRQYYTKRYEGLILLLFIEYSNMFSYNLNNIQYFARAAFVKNAYYKIEQPVFPNGTEFLFTGRGGARIIWNRHGVRVIVLQTGTIGIFDFQTALITFVSGLGLMAISTLIVDTLATRILPDKKIYNRYKFASANINDNEPKDLGEGEDVVKRRALGALQVHTEESFDDYGTFGRKFEIPVGTQVSTARI